ncbi:MAG: cyclic nucleotide-binding domain-containing protein [Chloroflexi bacterium]|nr:cyclic nucleotide-binding domain-containing protein [Chloroflexota bacterium]
MTTVRAPSKIIPRAFPGIKVQEIEQVIARSHIQNYKAGTVLCRENAIEYTFYMLLEGDVEVSKGINHQETRLLKTLTAGDFFGEMALIHNAPRAATVSAKTDVITLELNKDDFDEILKQSPSVSMAMVREISNRLRQNDDLAIEDLRIRAAELADAYQRLAEEDHTRHQLLTNIAHELRTPLMAASGYLQIMQKGMLPPDKLNEAVNTTARNVEQIASLVNDILFMQEVELVMPEFEPVDMAAIANRIVAAYEKKAAARRVRLSVRKDRSLAPAAGDPRSLERALTALVDNAVKFSPNGGDVEISLMNRVDQVQVSVKDEGIGISPEIRPRIFDRFFHVEKSGEYLFGGLGLGLSIARQVIQQHKGTLSVDSFFGHGSTFRIVLPAWRR